MYLPDDAMAKKKPTKPVDRHRPRLLIGLPDEYREPLEQLRRKNCRPTTLEIRMILDAHLKANGIEPPKGK